MGVPRRAPCRWSWRACLALALTAPLACADPGNQPPRDVPVVVRADSGASAERDRAAIFAELDTTLAVAISQSRLAAIQAQDVGLRAFAVRQVAHYSAVRRQLRGLAVTLHAMPSPSDRRRAGATRHAEELRALRVARGAQFDRVYVRHALSVHRDLLADLDEVLQSVDDAVLRDRLRRVGGTLGAVLPGQTDAVAVAAEPGAPLGPRAR